MTPIRGKIEKIICHHPASTGTMEANHNYHRNTLGWNGLGYDYWIDYDGTIYEVRGRNVGAHSGRSWNGKSYGPCFRGNFENQKMTDAQLKSGIWLCAMLCRMEGLTEKDIIGHKDVSRTACPGKNFRMKELKAGVTKLLTSAGVTYTVKKGDTLGGIASNYPGVTWQEIYAANKAIIGSNPNVIKPGQVLTIPVPVTGGAEVEALKSEIKDLTDQLKELELYAQEQKAKVSELEKVGRKIHADSKIF